MTTTIAVRVSQDDLEVLQAHREIQVSYARAKADYDDLVIAAQARGRPRWDFLDGLRARLTGHSEGRTLEEHLAKVAEWDAQHPAEASQIQERRHAVKTLEELLSVNEPKVLRVKAQQERVSALRSALAAVPRVVAAIEDGLRPNAALKAVYEFNKKPPGVWCLLLCGMVRTGKTTAAGALAYDFAQRGYRISWVRAAEAARSLFGEEADRRFSLWRTAKLLVIDDLGTEMYTAAWEQSLGELLDFRWQHSLRTIITTNLTDEKFAERYGVRIAARIGENGMVYSLGEDEMIRRTIGATT